MLVKFKNDFRHCFRGEDQARQFRADEEYDVPDFEAGRLFASGIVAIVGDPEPKLTATATFNPPK